MPRATPMPADERRAAIMAATEPLLEQHGRDVSTRQIADAAGVAEGTIFRVFPTKEALIDAVVEDAFDNEVTVAELSDIDADLNLEQQLLQAVEVVQSRMRRVFALFHSLRLRPPEGSHEDFRERQRADAELLNTALTALFQPHRERLSTNPADAAVALRALTFSLSHPMLTGGEFATPERIVHLLLNGVSRHAEPFEPSTHLSSLEGSAC